MRSYFFLPWAILSLSLSFCLPPSLPCCWKRLKCSREQTGLPGMLSEINSPSLFAPFCIPLISFLLLFFLGQLLNLKKARRRQFWIIYSGSEISSRKPAAVERRDCGCVFVFPLHCDFPVAPLQDSEILQMLHVIRYKATMHVNTLQPITWQEWMWCTGTQN